MKHLLVFVSCLMAAYPSFDPNGDLLPFISRLDARRRKFLAWGIAAVLALWQVGVGIGEDRDACRREAEQDVRYAEQKAQNEALQKEIGVANGRLVSATAQVSRLQRELDAANGTLVAQQRSIGSLLYNIETSFEGKRRFANCFDALALLDEQSDYKPLICDDGVAVFMFAKKDDRLTAFHFYANSEINEVLSGMPIDTELKIENGKFVVAKDSELALALERALERKTPNYGPDEESHRLALKWIEWHVRVFLRFAYRAESIQCANAYREVGRNRKKVRDGWRIVFGYDVSPAKTDSCRRSVEFWMTEADLVGLCGLTMRAFSEKLLEYCRSRGVEPKVRVDDIDILGKRGIRFKENRTFPYSGERVGGSVR